ncbi:MAG TPA: hypothetical protein VGM84_07585 [Steroidobacteraceae bacterium]|jgi:hypothetical protein
MVQARFLPGRRFTARLCVLLVLALVFAEAGAVQHQYAHGASNQVCADCLGFAPLLAPAGGKAHLPSIARVHAGTPCRQLVAPLAAQTPQNGFRSRAPPHFA